MDDHTHVLNGLNLQTVQIQVDLPKQIFSVDRSVADQLNVKNPKPVEKKKFLT